MTGTQKQRIESLRGKGESYSAIAVELGISANTIKSYCRRNNLRVGHTAGLSAQTEDCCDNCGKLLKHTQGAKKRRFCSDKCRLLWWKTHPEVLSRKAVYSFVCPTCGADFEAYGNAHRKYCSRACFGAARRALP